MPSLLTNQDKSATDKKLSIWGLGPSRPNQTLLSDDAICSKPVIEVRPWRKDNIDQRERVHSVSTTDDIEETMGDVTENVRTVVAEESGALIRLTTRTGAQELAEVLQQWEGVVTEIHEDTFCATLIDLTNNAQPKELVELDLSEISEADRHIFSEGSVFYWTIGRHWSPGGQMTRVSKIRLRRTPRWTRNAVAMIESRANSLMERFSNDSSSNSPAHR